MTTFATHAAESVNTSSRPVYGRSHLRQITLVKSIVDSNGGICN